MLHCRYIFLASAGLFLAGCSAAPEKAAVNKPKTEDAAPANSVAMSKQEISEEAGIPIYPGSSLPEGKSSVTADGPETQLLLVMITTDPVKKVVDFYSKKLPKVDARQGATSADIIGPTPKGTLAHLKISTDGKKTTIQATAVVEKDSKS